MIDKTLWRKGPNFKLEIQTKRTNNNRMEYVYLFIFVIEFFITILPPFLFSVFIRQIFLSKISHRGGGPNTDAIYVS